MGVTSVQPMMGMQCAPCAHVQAPMQQMMPCQGPAPMPMGMPVPTLNPAPQDAAQKELIEYIHNRQSDLPPDIQQKMKDYARKEGAKLSRNLEDAARQLNQARTDLEEALTARAQHIGTWKLFLAEAVKNWTEYANMFERHEQALQERIAQMKEQFQDARECLDASKNVAGHVSGQIQEISDEEDLPADSEQSARQIRASFTSLANSLQQLQKDAESIKVEEHVSNKRARVEEPKKPDEAMPGDGPSFGVAGHA
eukprot:s1235_g13.t1